MSFCYITNPRQLKSFTEHVFSMSLWLAFYMRLSWAVLLWVGSAVCRQPAERAAPSLPVAPPPAQQNTSRLVHAVPEEFSGPEQESQRVQSPGRAGGGGEKLKVRTELPGLKSLPLPAPRLLSVNPAEREQWRKHFQMFAGDSETSVCTRFCVHPRGRRPHRGCCGSRTRRAPRLFG